MPATQDTAGVQEAPANQDRPRQLERLSEMIKSGGPLGQLYVEAMGDDRDPAQKNLLPPVRYQMAEAAVFAYLEATDETKPGFSIENLRDIDKVVERAARREMSGWFGSGHRRPQDWAWGRCGSSRYIEKLVAAGKAQAAESPIAQRHQDLHRRLDQSAFAAEDNMTAAIELREMVEQKSPLGELYATVATTAPWNHSVLLKTHIVERAARRYSLLLEEERAELATDPESIVEAVHLAFGSPPDGVRQDYATELLRGGLVKFATQVADTAVEQFGWEARRRAAEIVKGIKTK